MAIYHGSKWTALLIAGLLLAGGGYVILIVLQSGAVDRPPPTVGPIESSGQSMDLAALPWTIFLLVATAVLGAGIAYGQYRAGKVTRSEREKGEKAVRKMYED